MCKILFIFFFLIFHSYAMDRTLMRLGSNQTRSRPGGALWGMYLWGIHVKRDNRRSIAYSEELIFPISATLQSTDRHHGIVGQEYCHFQRDS